MMTESIWAIASGRQLGKSVISDFIKRYNDMVSDPKIKWQRLPGLKLQAYVDNIRSFEPGQGFERGLRETDMDPIQAWTTECRCGTRMSFNIWQFKSEKQITMFLIRWS